MGHARRAGEGVERESNEKRNNFAFGPHPDRRLEEPRAGALHAGICEGLVCDGESYLIFEMNIEFTRTMPEEAEVLSDIAIESKGYWGYSGELLDIWRKDLRITSAYIDENTVRTIWAASERVGFFAIKQEGVNILDHLWLRPKAIGNGFGTEAFREILRECKDLGILEFIIVSDPDAEGFYLRQGAVRIGEVESVPQNRYLPKLCYTVGKQIQNQSPEAVT